MFFVSQTGPRCCNRSRFGTHNPRVLVLNTQRCASRPGPQQDFNLVCLLFPNVHLGDDYQGAFLIAELQNPQLPMQNGKRSPSPVGLDKQQLPQVPDLQRPTAFYPWREPVCTPNWAPVSFKIVPWLLLTCSLAVFNILSKFSKLHLCIGLFAESRMLWHTACTQRSKDDLWESILLLSVTLGTELRSSVLGARTSLAEPSCCPQTLDYWGHSVFLYL